MKEGLPLVVPSSSHSVHISFLKELRAPECQAVPVTVLGMVTCIDEKTQSALEEFRV